MTLTFSEGVFCPCASCIIQSVPSYHDHLPGSSTFHTKSLYIAFSGALGTSWSHFESRRALQAAVKETNVMVAWDGELKPLAA